MQDDKQIKQFLENIFKLYQCDIFNPFNYNISCKQLSSRFLQNLDKLVAEYQDKLKVAN